MRESRAPANALFPNDVVARGPGTVFYGLSRFHIGSVPASRYLSVPLFLLALLWSTGLLPGRWWGTTLFALTWLAFLIIRWQFQRRDYVRFAARDNPELTPQRLSSSVRIPIWATGRFSVEGKHQRFTCLPGYYQTFATGEHALLCFVRDRRFLRVARWPVDELGMWYVFFTPDVIRRIQVGDLTFGPKRSPALAIDYDMIVAPSSRSRNEKNHAETLYLVCDSETQQCQLFADLLYNLPVTQEAGVHSPQTS